MYIYRQSEINICVCTVSIERTLDINCQLSIQLVFLTCPVFTIVKQCSVSIERTLDQNCQVSIQLVTFLTCLEGFPVVLYAVLAVCFINFRPFESRPREARPKILVYVCTYPYIYIYIYVDLSLYIYPYTRVYIYTYIYIHIYIYIYMYMCRFVGGRGQGQNP